MSTRTRVLGVGVLAAVVLAASSLAVRTPLRTSPITVTAGASPANGSWERAVAAELTAERVAANRDRQLAASAARDHHQALVERGAWLSSVNRRPSRSRPLHPCCRALPRRPAPADPTPYHDPCPDTHEWHALVSCLWREAASTAFRVVHCESGGRPDAHNSSDHNGLFQIHHGPYDPEANTRLAYSMYRRRGWQPWNASRRCWG